MLIVTEEIFLTNLGEKPECTVFIKPTTVHSNDLTITFTCHSLTHSEQLPVLQALVRASALCMCTIF
jgi:hypothetical protein